MYRFLGSRSTDLAVIAGGLRFCGRSELLCLMGVLSEVCHMMCFHVCVLSYLCLYMLALMCVDDESCFACVLSCVVLIY